MATDIDITSVSNHVVLVRAPLSYAIQKLMLSIIVAVQHWFKYCQKPQKINISETLDLWLTFAWPLYMCCRRFYFLFQLTLVPSCCMIKIIENKWMAFCILVCQSGLFCHFLKLRSDMLTFKWPWPWWAGQGQISRSSYLRGRLVLSPGIYICQTLS